MKIGPSLLIAAASICSNASAQSLGSEPTKVTVSGVTFSRSLNGAAEDATVQADVLTVVSKAKRDNFLDPNGTSRTESAPVLLTRLNNSKPFTLIAKVMPEFRKTYDAGALYLWQAGDHWLKLAFEMDERGKTRMVTVRTSGTSDDNNHDVVTSESVYMKISSDTKKVGFYYSVDGKEWQMVRLFKNGYSAAIWAGVSSQSPLGDGNSTRFSEIFLSQASISDFRLGK